MRAFGYRCARILYLTVRGFESDRCLMRASALTFITGLSIVPLLAFAFAVAKGLGAYDTLLNDVLRPFLDQHLGAAAATGSGEVRQAIDQVLLIVKETNVSSLGTFGLAILAYTAIKLLGSIEQTLNEIWGVHKSRALLRRVSDYLSIILLVPILLTTATAVTTTLQSEWISNILGTELGFSSVGALYAKFSSLIAVWVGFTLLYLFMPNTKVQVSSALLGGLAGGLLWQGAQLLHLKFQVGVANYSAIYSTFAALPIFMFWLYLSWTTVLLGAEVAYAHQSEPKFQETVRSRSQDHNYLQVVTIRVLARVSVAFLRGDPPLRSAAIAEQLSLSNRVVEDVVGRMGAAGLLAVGDEQGYSDLILLTRDPLHVTLQDALTAIAGEEMGSVAHLTAIDSEADQFLERYRRDRRALASNHNFRRIAERCMELGSLEAAVPEAAPAVDGA